LHSLSNNKINSFVITGLYDFSCKRTCHQIVTSILSLYSFNSVN
jgi:hypothetical protein